MKELSIEEKAKRYDEAIEKAKDYYHLGDDKHKMAIDAKAVMEYIFPELKESEDERIRRKLLALVKWSKSYGASGITTDEAKEMTAWLEKQGGEKHQYKSRPRYVGEEELLGANKQGKQKLTNRVEPKFKVGDWIYHEISGNAFHINRIDNRTYISDEGATISFGRQNNWRLWTIKDAKDGDVLASNRSDIIIVRRVHKNQPFAYCGINNDEFMVSDSKEFWHEAYYHPATKEQRDTLMKAMADAGYTL